MANMPNLSAMYNMTEGGNSGGGGFLANDLLGALEASAQSDPGNSNAWGYTLSLKGGVFQGGWSIDKWATDIQALVYTYTTTLTKTGLTTSLSITSSSPTGKPNAVFNLGPPAPLPSAMAPNAKSYTCHRCRLDSTSSLLRWRQILVCPSRYRLCRNKSLKSCSLKG